MPTSISLRGIPGWKTDRGRIYITFGPPDEIEDHSSGGFYERPPEEGGGETSTFPFQQWRYRYIEGIGNNIIIEFVDPTMSGEFRMTSDPTEKEAFRHMPGTAAASRIFQFRSAQASSSGASAAPGRGGRGAGDGAVNPPASANIFTSVGDGPKVTLSVTSAKVNTQVSLALPSGSGKTDIIARITDANNQTVANLRFHRSRPAQL